MHPPAIIESIEPSEGPALGGTLIAVRGLHLHYGERHAYRCRLGQHRVVASDVPADGSVRCPPPPPPQHDLAYNNSNDAAVHAALNMALGSFAAQLNASSHNASSEQFALVASAAIDLAQPEPPLRAAMQPWNETHALRCVLSTTHYNASVAAAPVAVGVSLNDQDFSRASRGPTPAASYFPYAMAPRLEIVEPAFRTSVWRQRGRHPRGQFQRRCVLFVSVRSRCGQRDTPQSKLNLSPAGSECSSSKVKCVTDICRTCSAS